MVSLEIGRLLMEAGTSAYNVEQTIIGVATGLGADIVDVQVGYGSLTITVGIDSAAITRTRKVGPLGANQRLHYAVGALAEKIKSREFSGSGARAELDRLVRVCPRHGDFVVAISVGLACAALGRLLDADWPGVGPIFAAATIAQLVRRQLALRNVNVFLVTFAVAFLGSILCGFVGRLAGSNTVPRDMVSTVLLLVPGVPAFNAQLDMLEGRPGLGAARAAWVLTTLVFMSLGVWLALGLLGEIR